MKRLAVHISSTSGFLLSKARCRSKVRNVWCWLVTLCSCRRRYCRDALALNLASQLRFLRGCKVTVSQTVC